MIDEVGRQQRNLEGLEAANADAVHPLDIQLDSLLRNVASHPMPPYARPSALGRILEALLQGISFHPGEPAIAISIPYLSPRCDPLRKGGVHHQPLPRSIRRISVLLNAARQPARALFGRIQVPIFAALKR